MRRFYQRPPRLVSLTDATWLTFVPALSSDNAAVTGGCRGRHLQRGSGVYNHNSNGSVTFELRTNDGSVQTVIKRITLTTANYRYLFQEDDQMPLGYSLGLDIRLTGVPANAVVGIANFWDT